MVDYERVPYVFSLGDVRITFDNDIRESAFFGDLFEMTLPSYYVMERSRRGNIPVILHDTASAE